MYSKKWALCLLAASLLMPTTSFAAPSGGSRQPGHSVSITDYDAVPNDGTDDLAAINLAVAAAKASGKSVYIPEGTFIYSDLLVLDGVKMTGSGEKSVLKSTNLTHQAVVLEGTGAAVSKVKLTTVQPTVRLSNDESGRILVMPGTSGFSIDSMEIDGASSVGVFCLGSNGVISNNMVRNTLADGIHLTGATANIEVRNNVVRDTGDDHIAVVSYEKFGTWVRNVSIRDNDVAGGHARGITVSGGENITIQNNRIARTGGSGIYIASEGNYKTYAVKNLTVSKNTIEGDSSNRAVAERGGIRLQATNKEPSIQNAVFEKNTIKNSGDSGILILGSDTIDATFLKNDIDNPALYGIRILSTVSGKLNFLKNTVKSAGNAPFSNASTIARVISDMPNDPNAGDGGSGEDYVAVQGSPAIDGVVDSLWQNSSLLQLNTDENGTTGTSRIAWDDSALYYLFQIQDATPNAVSTNENNDSVEVWVDETNARNGAPTVGDYQLRVDLNNALSTVVNGLDLSGVRSAVAQGDGIYTVELAVPYTALTPKAGDIIGFNASANDDANGDGRRDTYLSWVDKNLPYWADTTAYGEVTLIAAP